MRLDAPSPCGSNPYASVRLQFVAMDALAGLLDGPRAREAFLLRCVMGRPWSMRIQDEAPLSVWPWSGAAPGCIPDDGDAVELRPGRRGGGPRTRCPTRSATTPPRPRRSSSTPASAAPRPGGVELVEALSLGVRTWGTDLNGPDDMLVGTYNLEGDVSRRLLARPAGAPRRAGRASWARPSSSCSAARSAKDDPGQEAVLDRLLDVLLIATLRAWFDRPGGDAPAWYRAQGDPIVGRALRLIYNHPARRWTVASLASEVGVSRAALARRFTDLVGEPPMAFLTEWRLTLAADLLRDPDETLASVAYQVGYSSPFALSTAFKRARGISPRDHRLAATG